MARELTGQGHDERSVTRCDDGVLVLHGRRSGAAVERPRISSLTPVLRRLGAQRKKGLHGEDEAFLHDSPLGLNRPGCDLSRLLMQRMPDSMAGKISNKRIAISASERADRRSDIAERLVRTNLPDAGPHCATPITAKPLDRFGYRRHGERCARVGKNPILLRGNVDIDEVTCINSPVPWYAVRDFFVDTDAGCTREAVAKLGSGRGPCFFQKGAAELVQFACSYSWLYGRSHGYQRVGNNASDLFEPAELIIA